LGGEKRANGRESTFERILNQGRIPLTLSDNVKSTTLGMGNTGGQFGKKGLVILCTFGGKSVRKGPRSGQPGGVEMAHAHRYAILLQQPSTKILNWPQPGSGAGVSRTIKAEVVYN